MSQSISSQPKGTEITDPRAFKLVRGLNNLIKLLPDPCFRDGEQRKQIQETLAAFLEREVA